MLTWHHVNRPDREREKERERRSRRSRRLIESTRNGGAGFNARERESEDEGPFVFFELKPLYDHGSSKDQFTWEQFLTAVSQHVRSFLSLCLSFSLSLSHFLGNPPITTLKKGTSLTLEDRHTIFERSSKQKAREGDTLLSPNPKLNTNNDDS